MPLYENVEFSRINHIQPVYLDNKIATSNSNNYLLNSMLMNSISQINYKDKYETNNENIPNLSTQYDKIIELNPISNIKSQQELIICHICERKFQSLEKLKLHEDQSALHKENLRKKGLV